MKNSFFILSNPRDWYVIAVGECNHALACMLSPKVYVFLRIDYIHNFIMIAFATKVAITFLLATSYMNGSFMICALLFCLCFLNKDDKYYYPSDYVPRGTK